MLRKQVIDSLLTYEKDLRKQHKTVVVPVEKAFSAFTDSINALIKVGWAAGDPAFASSRAGRSPPPPRLRSRPCAGQESLPQQEPRPRGRREPH